MGSKCFFFVFVACLGGFLVCFVVVFSPEMSRRPLQNCYMPYCTHKLLQYFYFSFNQALAQTRAVGPPHIPSWGLGCRCPLCSQELLLCQSWNASWSACLVSLTCMSILLGQAQRDISTDGHICSGEPWFTQRVSLGVSVTSFHQNVYFLSIVGMSFKSIANTLILSFNQILAMFSIYKLILTHTNLFFCIQDSFSLNLLLILPFMSKPGTAAQLTALLTMQVYKRSPWYHWHEENNGVKLALIPSWSLYSLWLVELAADMYCRIQIKIMRTVAT